MAGRIEKGRRAVRGGLWQRVRRQTIFRVATVMEFLVANFFANCAFVDWGELASLHDVKDDSIRVLFVVKTTREMKEVLLKVLLDYKIA